MRQSGLSFFFLVMHFSPRVTKYFIWLDVIHSVGPFVLFNFWMIFELNFFLVTWLNGKNFIGYEEMHMLNSKSNNWTGLLALNWYLTYHISCILAVNKIRRSNFLLSKMNYFQNFETLLSNLGYLPTKNPPHWFQKLENLLECYSFFKKFENVISKKCGLQ